MQKRKFFEVEVDEELWEMAGWDLPGLTKSAGREARVTEGTKARKPERQKDR